MSSLDAAFRRQIVEAFKPPEPKYRWRCVREECDGRPHPGAPESHARTKQRIPEGPWFIWLLLLGRGWGKTRTGAESFLALVLASPKDQAGHATEWLIASDTFKNTVANCLEGPSGLFNVMRAHGIEWRTNWQRQVITLSTGQRIHIAHAEDDDLARGKNLAGAWLDELGTFRKILAAWREGLVPAMRALMVDARPRIIITTTPKVTQPESLELLKSLIARHEGGDPSVHVTRGTTWENAHNLSPETLAEWERDYPVGSRAYRQELLGEICEEIEGAMWSWNAIADNRAECPEPIRSIVSVDPAVTSGPTSDETGIVLVSKAMRGEGREREAHFYVREDRSGRFTMDRWAEVALRLAEEHDATIIVEVDNGGDLHAKSLRDTARQLRIPVPRIELIRAAGKGSKATRAATVVSLYERGRVHHVCELAALEKQMTTWVPEQSSNSPDRVDALVHAVRELSKVTAKAVPIRRLS